MNLNINLNVAHSTNTIMKREYISQVFYNLKICVVKCVYYFVVLFVFVSVVINGQGFKQTPGREDTLKIFSNLQSVMDVLQLNKAKMPLQTDLVLQAFYTECAADANLTEPLHSKMPFIVIEGNTVEDAQATAKKIAMLINARYIPIPPNCLHRFTYFFQKGTILRRTFFGIARYGAAYTAMKTLDRPSVVSGYWYDHLAFVLSRLYGTPGELPPFRNPIYRLPRDLLKPDLLFYMYFPYTVLNHPFTTKAPFWKPKLVQIYERFDDVYFINVIHGRQHATNLILNITLDYLKERFNQHPLPSYVS